MQHTVSLATILILALLYEYVLMICVSVAFHVFHVFAKLYEHLLSCVTMLLLDNGLCVLYWLFFFLIVIVMPSLLTY